jgi:hypothetical protein
MMAQSFSPGQIEMVPPRPVRDLLTQHGDRVVASDTGLAMVDLAGRIDGEVPGPARPWEIPPCTMSGQA